MIPLNERVSCPPAAFFLTFPEQLIGRRLLKMFRFQMDDSRGLVADERPVAQFVWG